MAEDLSVFFYDPLLTVPVVFGVKTTSGIFDQPEQDLSSGLVATEKYKLLMRITDFATDPVGGAAIKVDGVDFTINSFNRIDDGKLVQLDLSKV